jgi:16S rRNA G966 N2-methylase RsmD
MNDDDTDKKYMEPTILQNINLEKYFAKEDIDKALFNKKVLKITDKGLYSISKYYDAKWISDIIIKFLTSENIDYSSENIIDGTAGIGGNTINFCKYFKFVYAIEINNVHFNVLNNNLDALSIKNVTSYMDNFLNILDITNNSNIYFLDPPWGGKSYKNYKYFNLKIGKLPIYNIINILYDKKIKYVILKAPVNLNLSSIYENIKYENMNIFSNKKKSMILCIFY